MEFGARFAITAKGITVRKVAHRSFQATLKSDQTPRVARRHPSVAAMLFAVIDVGFRQRVCGLA